MSFYNIKIEPEALQDIQRIAEWYENQQEGLGDRFVDVVIQDIDSLPPNPYVYAIRYNSIRCLIVHSFPYMVHFYVNQKTNTIEILAVIGMSQSPDTWYKKTGKG